MGSKRKYTMDSYITKLDEQYGHNKRPKNLFFNDIQATIDERLINQQLSIIAMASSGHLYKYNNAMKEKLKVNFKSKEVFRLKKRKVRIKNTGIYKKKYFWPYRKFLFRNIIFLFECCRTLTYARDQLEAAEHQWGNEATYRSPFLPEDVPYDFFEKLYKLKEKYKFRATAGMTESKYILNCKRIYEKCIVRPISAMLLPAILTIYSIDGSFYENTYPYLKYKSRRLSQNDREHVLPLFNEISEVVKKQFEKKKKYTITVFLWNNIEYRFFDFQDLSEDECQEARNYIEKYCHANGLSRKEENKLLKLHYGEKLRALAKLCNINIKIMSDYLPEEDLPSGAVSARKQLLADKILPKYEDRDNLKDIYKQYFIRNYDYINVPSFTDFSKLAVLRYYRLPFQDDFESIPNILNLSTQCTRWLIEEFCTSIRKKYYKKLFSSVSDSHGVKVTKKHKKDKKSNPKNCQEIIRKYYSPKSVIECRDYTEKTRSLVNIIIKEFEDLDYREFISDTKNFDFIYFPEYLKHFCEKHKLNDYGSLCDEEKATVEEVAFSEILQLVQAFLSENLDSFWRNIISEEVHDVHD